MIFRSALSLGLIAKLLIQTPLLLLNLEYNIDGYDYDDDDVRHPRCRFWLGK